MDARSRAGLSSQIDRLVGPVSPAAAFGTYVVGCRDPAARLGRQLEAEVFGEAFGNSEALLATEYGPYEASSAFVLVVDHRRKVLSGVIRILVPSPAGLKTLHDINRFWDRDPLESVRSTGIDAHTGLVWDLATLAVGRQYRRATTRGLISLALWQAIGVLATRAGVDLLVAIIDVTVYRLLQSKLVQLFTPFDDTGPRPYLDSPASRPVWSRPDQCRTRFGEADQGLYRLMVEGVGLEAAVAPPDWEAAAATLQALSLERGGHAPSVGLRAPDNDREVSLSNAGTSSPGIALANSQP